MLESGGVDERMLPGSQERRSAAGGPKWVGERENEAVEDVEDAEDDPGRKEASTWLRRGREVDNVALDGNVVLVLGLVPLN